MKPRDLKKFYLSKPNEDYKNINVELAFKENYDINITSNNIIYEKEEKDGKYFYNITDNLNKYDINISKVNETKEGGILLKYKTKKDIAEFYIYDNELNVKDYGASNNLSDNNTKNIKFGNIKCNDDTIKNYTIRYIIILYNTLDFFDNEEINNIFLNVRPNKTFRTELSENDLKLEELSYDIDFGRLDNGEYCVSVIGEVYYNDNIEYFNYKYKSFDVKPLKNPEFDGFWFIPLSIVIATIVALGAYLIIIIKCKNKNEEVTGKYLIDKANSENIEMN
jgi:hypothetical protein